MLPTLVEMLIHDEIVKELLRLRLPALRKVPVPSKASPAPMIPVAAAPGPPFVDGNCSVLSVKGKVLWFRCQTRSNSGVVENGPFHTAPLVFEAANWVCAGLPQ